MDIFAFAVFLSTLSFLDVALLCVGMRERSIDPWWSLFVPHYSPSRFILDSLIQLQCDVLVLFYLPVNFQ